MKKLIVPVLVACTLLVASCENSHNIAPEKEVALTEKNIANPVMRRYSLNAETSIVEWKGYSPGVSHQGSFRVSGEDIEVVNGKIKGGIFRIPIASIQNYDLPEDVKPILLEHLKSPDFFNLALYPEASFTIKRVVPLPYPLAGELTGANYQVTGNFTMLGKTNEISFPARIVLTGNAISVEAVFKIDRTKWGMTYAADPALGNHHIYPEVDLHLTLSGTRK
jgi:polyisoprenoid-binding protein YceI